MGRSLGDRYQVDGRLGEGPRGVVFAGTDNEGHRFAFKTLREDLQRNPDLVARYLQVQGALSGLMHPNLVPVHELVVEGDAATVVMDLVPGPNLRQLIAGNGPLLPAEVARLGSGIAKGIAQLHRSGVVHGDVKPENVLLDETISPKVPRLTDFIVARLIGLPNGRHGTPVLTEVRYLAPELANGGVATPASDLYALGIILYELCCGVAPFIGDSPYSVIRQHVEYERAGRMASPTRSGN